MNRLFDSHGDILRASESTLIYFVTFLARRVKHGTIRTYLAAVRNMHIENGFQDPIQGRLISNKVLRGILRGQGQHKTARQPVTPQLLKAIRPVLLSWLSAHDFHMIYILRDAARACGFPHSSLKGHSLRIGTASYAAAAGLPDWLIKVLGRWSSDCYQLYVRTPQNILLTAAPNDSDLSIVVIALGRMHSASCGG
ncbi:uncharacterized protein LOC125563135 [Nematostella vectensis]|uniref:uncharacterized protein LOC125563135 n=1 Tax=Nematostella vectensis TaxID=45351 RepID=UPI002076F2C7|nr:uncharacterized protein LOC125563135 [Nematostella vectensis]